MTRRRGRPFSIFRQAALTKNTGAMLDGWHEFYQQSRANPRP
jgi:hypothetical protein